jgi:hypothetical protein
MTFTVLRSAPDHSVLALEDDTAVTSFKTGREHQNATWNWTALVGVPPETQPTYTQTVIISSPTRCSRC